MKIIKWKKAEWVTAFERIQLHHCSKCGLYIIWRWENQRHYTIAIFTAIWGYEQWEGYKHHRRFETLREAKEFTSRHQFQGPRP